MENDSCSDPTSVAVGGGETAETESFKSDSDAAAAVPTGSLIDHPSMPDPDTASTPSTPNPNPSEGSWEERYNKLKSLTLRYKKKIADQNTEIETLRTKQTASKIQFEYDKALDEIEQLKKADKLLQKDLAQAVNENVELKMKDAESSSQIQALSSSHKAMRERLETLEKEADLAETLKGKIEALEKEVNEARTAGVDAEQDKRQAQMLSLEVKDYEKKLEEACGVLEEKKVECEKLLEEIARKDEKIKGLDGQVKDLKEVENRLILAKESLQADNSRKSEKITFLQEESGKQAERLSEKRQEAEKLSQELQEAKSENAATSKSLNEKLNLSQKTIASLEQKISVLEENKRNRETQIANLKLEMNQLESDYVNYKTKAQAMLKSQKSGTPILDGDEIERLQKVIQGLHSEAAILKSELQTLKLENETLTIERADLNVRLNQLRSDAIEKELQLSSEIQKLKQSIRQNEENFAIQLERKDTEAEKSNLALTSQMEALKRSYENRIKEYREKYEMLKMNTEVNNDKDTHTTRTEGLLVSAESEQSYPLSQPLTIDTGNPSNLTFEQLQMMPRGEGEGSESVTSIPIFTPRADEYNISFEQLLSSSFDSVTKDFELDHDNKARESLEKELTRCQTQILHLTSLLRESESNCDRLAQLSDALKEEIRRVERDKDRQEHLKENTEYLKNVLLKFVTLSGEAERQRLIPVLKTMLRLTNDEVDRLHVVVKGRAGTGNPQPSTTGWSSYLPLWSGGGTGG